MTTKILVDGNNLAFRVYFTHKYLRSGNQFTGAIYGALMTMQKLKQQFPDERIIVCWDSRESPRKQLTPSYKSGRVQNNDRIKVFEQMPKIREIFTTLGIINVETNGLEADDLLAILSKTYEKKSILISNDSDLFQLLNRKCYILDVTSNKKYTVESFSKEYGISPNLWDIVLAIAGKSSNNIPGVHGVGFRTAIKFLMGQKVRPDLSYKIHDALSDGTIYKTMVLTHLPFTTTKTPKLQRPVKSKEKFQRLCMEYRFNQILKNFKSWEHLFFENK